MLSEPFQMLAGIPAHVWRAKRSQFRIPLFRSDDKTENGPKSSETDTGDTGFPNNFDPRQLQDLNKALVALTALFPDVRVEVFREMLMAFSEDSRLELVAEQLIKHKAKWVKGRWRVPVQQEVEYKYKYRVNQPTRNGGESLADADKFRSNAYKVAVRSAFYQEFKSLSKSTVQAVLAEYNYSYTEARPTLLALSSKSWKNSLSNLFFLRRKPPAPIDHPLITWQPIPGGGSQPVLKMVGNEELNLELHRTLIEPLRQKKVQEQICQDTALAEQLNEVEAEAAEANFDCEVCFMPNTFEKMTTCDNGAHYICFRCVRHTMKEVLFGQGWARSIDSRRSTLKCIAPVASNDEECEGCVSHELVRRALGDTKEGIETWQKFEERAAAESLLKSHINLIKCPFCIYAVEDDRPPTISSSGTHPRLIPFATLLVGIFYFWKLITPIFALSIMLLPLVITSNPVGKRIKATITTLTSSTRCASTTPPSLKFVCNNPVCARSSCVTCKKEWLDIHLCFSSEKLALRAYVESAMADAVKRTCPKCNLSFVKSEACNKMTCICGYKMCYVCRKEIDRSEGYSHFCQHFRIVPGVACSECDKCDLYRTEDDEVLIRKAKEQAEEEWRERENFRGGWRWEENVLDV